MPLRQRMPVLCVGEPIVLRFAPIQGKLAAQLTGADSRHFAKGAAQAVKTVEKPHSIDIRVSSTYAVVPPPNLVAKLIPQLGGTGNWGCLHFRFRTY